MWKTYFRGNKKYNQAFRA
uniref:Uncharacterized protein n=1 Tax=Rhizophora mucronata TaxID=61149 RepID=A0A2P2JAL2_RHIMU